MQYQSSTSSPVATTSRATFLGTTTPDKNYVPSDLSMMVTALPPNGTVVLADGFTPVRPRQVLTLAQLEALKFRPALSSTAGSQASGSSTTNPAGVVVDAEARPPAGYSVLSVPQDSGARTIGIQISSATDYLAPETCAIITGLPSNGTVLLADGMTSVTQGQTLTAVQLKRLRFRPAIDAIGQISDLHYLIVGPTGGALAGCVLLIVRPVAPPLNATAQSAPDRASVAESSSAGSAGPAARLETRLSSGSSSKLPLSVLRMEKASRKCENVLPTGADMQESGRDLKVKRPPFPTGNRRRPRNASANFR